MSLSNKATALVAQRFPRVSGDEPGQVEYRSAVTLFSPRERG